MSVSQYSIVQFLFFFSKTRNRKFGPTGICYEGDGLVAVHKTSSFLHKCQFWVKFSPKWAGSWEMGNYQIYEQRRLRRACASTQSCHSLRCSLTKYRELDKVSDKQPPIWPHWMAVLAHLKDHKMDNTNVLFLERWLNDLHTSTASLSNNLSWRQRSNFNFLAAHNSSSWVRLSFSCLSTPRMESRNMNVKLCRQISNFSFLAAHNSSSWVWLIFSCWLESRNMNVM